MEAQVPPLKYFVLPGGNQLVSFCHIARTVCRRAERRILDLTGEAEVDELVVKYMNRLSDYLFMTSRWKKKNGFPAGMMSEHRGQDKFQGQYKKKGLQGLFFGFEKTVYAWNFT